MPLEPRHLHGLKGRPGAIGSTSFGMAFTNRKVVEFDNQYVFNDL